MQRMTIDALPLLGQGGISNYIRPFICELVRQTSPQWRIELLLRLGFSKERKKSFNDAASAGLPAEAAVRVVSLPDIAIRLLWERGMFAAARPESKSDLFLATTELVPRCKKATVGYFVYDIVPLMIPEKYTINLEQYAIGLFNRLRNADFVITISETSKNDLVARFKYPEHKIFVVYPGSSPMFGQSLEPVTGKPRRPYILYMGALALNKNVDGLIRIFSRCIKDHRCDYDLILTGRDFCGRAFWDNLTGTLGISDRVRFVGWVSNQERGALLAGATMLWQLSWYEGFGLPVLEAAAAGIPVLCSNRGSLPEILRNKEQEIDPDDEDGAAAKAAQALASPQILEAWKARGLARAQNFTWQKSLREFLARYADFRKLFTRN
jgi:glycosyltransferase involved in cell wall biosynthesis